MNEDPPATKGNPIIPFMDAVNAEKASGAEINYAKRGDTVSVGDLVFSVLNPPETLFKDRNNNSIVLGLEYGSVAFLFSGDAEKEAEESMVSSGNELRAQILKAGHHCSRTASLKPYLAKVKPEIAVCMIGAGNKFRHPPPGGRNRTGGSRNQDLQDGCQRNRHCFHRRNGLPDRNGQIGKKIVRGKMFKNETPRNVSNSVSFVSFLS